MGLAWGGREIISYQADRAWSWTAATAPTVTPRYIPEPKSAATSGMTTATGSRTRASTYITCYRDVDHDGWGDSELADSVCEDCEYGWTLAAGDCDNDAPHAFPGGTELCDEADNDCDCEIDEGLDTVLAYRDVDEDGFGDPLVSDERCSLDLWWTEYEWVEDNTDCLDPTFQGSCSLHSATS